MNKLAMTVLVALAATLVSVPCARADEEQAATKPDCAALQADLFADLKAVVKAGCMPSQAQIAKLLDNPVGNFIAIPLQLDVVQLAGPHSGHTENLERLQIVPTFPLSLGTRWNLINRVVLPAMSMPINEAFGDCIGYTRDTIRTCPSFPDALADPFKPTRGFGDVVYVALASPKAPIRVEKTKAAVVWGLGGTVTFPTASEKVLGNGKYSVGPAAVAAYLGKTWTLGLLAQQWWSVAGDSQRADVNVTNLQYFLFYSPHWNAEAQWRIGMTPNISYDWKATGDKLTLPVGLGISRMATIGKLPVRLLLEADYSVVHPGDKPGSRWDFRFYFIPVIPTFLL
jgi:hypothetical protein